MRRKAAAVRLNWEGLGDIFFHIDDAPAIDAEAGTLVEFDVGTGGRDHRPYIN